MDASGPTRGADESGRSEWRVRKGVAALVRFVAIAVPLAVGVGAARVVGPVLWRPDGLIGALIFLLEVAVVATAAATAADRFTRKLLPLAALLRMSLVFPDEAPSRFKVALRAGSTKRIAAQLQAGTDRSPSETAELLLEMVAALGKHDRLTRGHTERVRAYSELIADEMGLSRPDREMLRWGVLVHDVGKLSVPAEVLNKKGKLTDEEWAVLKRHPEVGGSLVEPLAEWLGPWRLAASEHHERFDGTGYPNGISGADISLAGRIVAVADAYDVITSARSYKRPTPPEAARAELVRCAGSQFDPLVVRAMLNVSLGRLRLAGGPLGALTELPLLGRVPAATHMASSGSVIAATTFAATALAIAAAAPPADSDSSPVVAAAAVAEHSDYTPSTTTPVTITVHSPSTSMSTTTSATTSTLGAPEHPVSTSSAPRPAYAPSNTTVPPPAATRAPATTTQPVANTSPPPAPPPPPSPETLPPPAPPATTAAPSGPTPNLQPDSITVKADKDEHVWVLLNDAPLSGTLDESTLTIVTPPNYAKDFRVHDDHLHYRSLKTFTGTDTLTYRVCDTSGACGTAVVTITVTK